MSDVIGEISLQKKIERIRGVTSPAVVVERFWSFLKDKIRDERNAIVIAEMTGRKGFNDPAA